MLPNQDEAFDQLLKAGYDEDDLGRAFDQLFGDDDSFEADFMVESIKEFLA